MFIPQQSTSLFCTKDMSNSTLTSVLQNDQYWCTTINNVITYNATAGDEDLHCRLLTWLNAAIDSKSGSDIGNILLCDCRNNMLNGKKNIQYAMIRGYRYTSQFNARVPNIFGPCDHGIDLVKCLFQDVTWSKDDVQYRDHSPTATTNL